MADPAPALIKASGPLNRRLFLAQVPELRDWPAAIEAPEPHFVLFLAANATGVEDDELEAFAHKLLDQGTAYVSVWGPDCERAHACFDTAEVKAYPGRKEIVMTVDNRDESLDEALWCALFNAWPNAAYEATCGSLLAIAVGDGDWAAQIERRLADPDRLLDDLELRD